GGGSNLALERVKLLFHRSQLLAQLIGILGGDRYDLRLDSVQLLAGRSRDRVPLVRNRFIRLMFRLSQAVLQRRILIRGNGIANDLLQFTRIQRLKRVQFGRACSVSPLEVVFANVTLFDWNARELKRFDLRGCENEGSELDIAIGRVQASPELN